MSGTRRTRRGTPPPGGREEARGTADPRSARTAQAWRQTGWRTPRQTRLLALSVALVVVGALLLAPDVLSLVPGQQRQPGHPGASAGVGPPSVGPASVGSPSVGPAEGEALLAEPDLTPGSVPIVTSPPPRSVPTGATATAGSDPTLDPADPAAAPAAGLGWRAVAHGFATDFTASGPDRADRLSRWVSPDLAVDLATTDPRRVPAGELVALREAGAGAGLVTVVASYDSDLHVWLRLELGTERWQVTAVEPVDPESVDGLLRRASLG